ncbi:RNA polymerase sigma factor [Filimonas effusa]|uniref:RNA polymerase sigma-70 factor n=1 Tax=Filimonas effusa TaxID=2508721 RepID=A0A4Q1DC37_9BACT|nr:RNA polymerase sigma-70 factor [Filimonas effusa]RXK87002.1 RNA polymerase sigma-70 factor [Filimonas effusa]
MRKISTIESINYPSDQTFRIAFDTYYPKLCFFANKLLNDWDEAEDIVEETFVKIWNKQSDFNRFKNIKAILYISVKNACTDAIRKRQRNNQAKASLKYYLADETESFALTEIIRAEIIAQMHRELLNLPVECRNVMHLLYEEGQSTKEAAEQLGLNVSTIRSHKAKGLQILRKRLGIISILNYILLSVSIETSIAALLFTTLL